MAKVPDIQQQALAFDEEGMNFFHCLLVNVLAKLREGLWQQLCQRKAQDYGQFLQQVAEVSQEERSVLQGKSTGLDSRVEKRTAMSIDLLIEFCAMLKQRGFDFFVDVRVVKTDLKAYKLRLDKR